MASVPRAHGYCAQQPTRDTYRQLDEISGLRQGLQVLKASRFDLDVWIDSGRHADQVRPFLGHIAGPANAIGTGQARAALFRLDHSLDIIDGAKPILTGIVARTFQRQDLQRPL